MSLVKKPVVTAKKLAANRRNRRPDPGSIAAARRARIRSAHLRNGFSAEAESVAMRALGEDPAQYEDLVEGLWETYHPTDAAQEGLVIQLAWATWLMNRAIRMQEGLAVRQAQAVNVGRADRLHVQMMRLKITAETLRALAGSVAHQYYVTLPSDFETMQSLCREGEVSEMGQIILLLFAQLNPPVLPEGEKPEEDHEEVSARVLTRIKAIFGITDDYNPHVSKEFLAARAAEAANAAQDLTSGPAGSANVAPDLSPAPSAAANVAPDLSPAHAELKFSATKAGADSSASSEPALKAVVTPEYPEDYPQITPEDWEARERPRQLLYNILMRQVVICEAQRQATLEVLVKGPSLHERAAEIAPTHPNAALLRKLQDSYFTEIRRVTNLLLKVKRYGNAVGSRKKNRRIPRSARQEAS